METRQPDSAPTVEPFGLPPFIDLVTAAGLLGIGRTLAYALVKDGRWPTPIVRLGNLIRVPSAALLALTETGTEVRRSDARRAVR